MHSITGSVRVPRTAVRCAAFAGLALVIALAACDRGDDALHAAAQLTGGDPARGPGIMRQYGCGSCHTIPGVRGATGMVGPPLTGMALRAYIAGVLPNTPDNMIRWLRNPPAVDALTAMPNLGITDQDARDIAGYLYTLK